MPCDKDISCPDRDRFACNAPDHCPSLPSCIRVSGEYQVHAARRSALQWTEFIGMSSLESTYVATAVSELANNQLLHTANGGVIQIIQVEKNGWIGIEVVAKDEGPGIACIEAAMRDGYSTNGGLGAGLGGTRRLMDEFEIKSEFGAGTRIVARKWRR